MSDTAVLTVIGAFLMLRLSDVAVTAPLLIVPSMSGDVEDVSLILWMSDVDRHDADILVVRQCRQ